MKEDSHPGVESVQGSKLDVLVVAYHSERTLPTLLESVRSFLPIGTRVVVWCNSDAVPLRAVVARELARNPAPRVEVLGGDENLGFARACNALAHWSDRQYLLFLNPDAEITEWPGDLQPSAGSVQAPVILNPDSTHQESYGLRRTLADEFAIRILRRRAIGGPPEIPRSVGYVSGAAFLVRKSDFLRIGGFDDDFFMYYEDIDFGRRWSEAGGSLWVDPRWVVRHIGGASAKSDHLTALQRSQISAENFHAKWSGSARLFVYICFVEAVLKSIVAVILGRVGLVERRTQIAYTKWLFWRRRNANAG